MVDVEGFEGPLDLLLTLARQQKVDLAKISILALADQYLAFIEAARKMRLELAADYLVMAAWLAYLKSRLLLPEPHPAEGVSAEDMANALAQRLRRLEAIRQVAEQLLNRPQLGRDVFARGQPEPIAEIKRPEWSATLYDLLSAYAGAAADQGAVFCAHAQAHGVVARRGARGARAPDRPVAGLEPARSISHRLSGRAVDARRRCWRRALPRRSNWCAKGAWKCTSRAHSRRSICVSGRAGEGPGSACRGSGRGIGEWVRGRLNQWRMSRRCA